MVKLEKLHSYNAIRALRVVLPLIVLGLLALGFSNYWSRLPTSSAPEERRLVDNVSELSEDVRFSRTESGRQVFTVEADQNVGTEDGRSVLEGVRIRIFGQDVSSPDRLISSPHCSVEESTGDISCMGDAEVRFDDRTTIETTNLVYINAQRVVRTLEPARVFRPGEFEANADALVLHLDEEVVVLDGAVTIRPADGSRLDTTLVRYFQREDRAEVSGGLRLSTAEGELRGREAEIFMAPGTLSPEVVRVRGRVTAYSSTDGERVSIGADSLEVRLAGDRIEDVTARGAASAEAGAGPDRRTLSGDVLQGFFLAAGELEAVEARGGALMVISSGEELRAPVIRYGLDGSSARTTGESRFETGELSIDGADFRIAGEDRVVFDTDLPATIRTPSSRLEAETTRAVMSGGTGEIVEMVQRGNARFEQDGRSGRAREITFARQDRIVLAGDASFRDGDVDLAARMIDIDLTTERFRASGSVEAVLSDPGNPILVIGDDAAGGGDQLRVEGAAQLWRGNVHVAANVIDILPGERAFTAIGDVRSVLDRYRVQSDRLVFDDRQGQVEYSGTVRARSGEIDFDSERLDVYLTPAEDSVGRAGHVIDDAASERIDRIVATGAVEFHSGETTGWGDEAVYSRETRTVTLRGDEAEVSGGASGTSRGTEFVWSVDEERIVMTGGSGKPAVSRRPVQDE